MVDVAKRAGRMGSIERLGFVWLALLAAACGGRTSRSTASSNGAGGATNQTDASTTEARWARMAVSPKMSFFDAVAADRSGNAYAAGYFSGPSTLDLGDGVTIAGAYAGDNAFLVKYDSGGRVQWARTVAAGSIGSRFPSVAVDPSGNVYVVGSLYPASGDVDFGDGFTFTKSDTFHNAVLVKYDASGAVAWVRAISAGPGDSIFNSLAVDAAGNLSVAGAIEGTGTYDFGNDVTATGTAAGDPSADPPYGQNVVLVKYDAAGIAQWAQTVAAGSLDSRFDSVRLDSAGNAYALGAITGLQTYDFGHGVTATGMPIQSHIANPGGASVLVKYDPAGTAQWAQAVTAALMSVAVDPAGNAYAVGQLDSRPCDFGNGVTAAGTLDSDDFTGLLGPAYVLLVKYDSSGVARWARTVASSGQNSYFDAVAVDASGNVLAAGGVMRPGTYDFGDGATVTAVDQDGYAGVVVKYDAEGIADWARSARHDGSSGDVFSSVTVDPLNDVYVAGGVSGTGLVDFGDGAAVTTTELSSPGWSALLVEYR
jgi:hypothetical protein